MIQRRLKHILRFAPAGILITACIRIQPITTLQAAGGLETPQILLFDRPYLRQLKVPSALNYSYRHATSEAKQFGPPFTDTIAVNVNEPTNPENANSVSMRIFSGERQRDLGPNVDMKGNPIIMIFLERDLWEMKRRIGGVPIFYRNKLRQALRDKAVVKKTEITFEGKPVPAHTVTIMPFAQETQNVRMKKFLKKTYEFTVADAVPGGFVSVRSVVPGGDGEVLIEDEITFLKAD